MNITKYTPESANSIVTCENCGWRGRIGECPLSYHTVPFTNKELDSTIECPKCGFEFLEITSIMKL